MIHQLRLTQELLQAAGAFFEECGSLGHEGTAMIKASASGEAALVIPAQKPYRDTFGHVSVEVELEGQLQLARSLQPGEIYVARIHSHPAEAFHSRTDDRNPILTHDGALSIVVPYFGLGLRRGLHACAVFRREDGHWIELPSGVTRDRWLQATGVES